MKRVVINQSNYLPWKGYFDLIHDADVFVFYDDVQFTKNDWRNRNKVKTADGTQWLTVPVGKHLHRRVSDVTLTAGAWQQTHWKTLHQLYGKAPHFTRYAPLFEEVYLRRRWDTLSELNQFLIRSISGELGIAVDWMNSADIEAAGSGEERVLAILKTLGAAEYVSGPAGRAYLHPSSFDAAGIRLRWKDYSGYPEYPQFHPPFDHAVTILDLLFQTGPDAPYYVWGWRDMRTGREHPGVH
jgi:hypothetical protein